VTSVGNLQHYRHAHSRPSFSDHSKGWRCFPQLQQFNGQNRVRPQREGKLFGMQIHSKVKQMIPKRCVTIFIRPQYQLKTTASKI
jgi:hypothetical protein